MEEIKKLCKEYPNDADLGKQVRALIDARESKAIDMYLGIVFSSLCLTFLADVFDKMQENAVSEKKRKKRKK